MYAITLLAIIYQILEFGTLSKSLYISFSTYNTCVIKALRNNLQ